MRLYIDKENLLTFIASKNNEFYQKCMELFRSELDLFFNFSKDEIVNQTIVREWFQQLGTQEAGYTAQIKWNSDFPSRPLKSNTVNTFTIEDYFSVFLLYDEDILKFKNNGSAIVGSVGEEIDTIMELCFNNGKKFTFTRELRIGEKGFEKWEDLSDFTTPLTDILIIDPYIFKKSENSLITIEINLIKILEILCADSKYKVKIVIVYKESDYDLDEIKDKISKKLQSILKKKPDITFVKTYNEHDRTIITNYIRITGNTFNYFDNSGKKINKGKDIVIRSLADYEFYNNAIQAINDVQKIVKKNNDIFGDKISNFIDFTI